MAAAKKHRDNSKSKTASHISKREKFRIPPLPFPKFTREERLELTVFSGLLLTAYFFMKWCYPTTFTTADSGDYVACAISGSFGGFRPVGYSWFLILIHFFSSGLAFTIFIQFLLHAISALYFVFAIRRFFPPAKLWLYRVFALLILLNDSTLYMTTWLLSDSVNASFTFIAFAALLRLLENPKRISALALMLVALYSASEMRYASLACIPVFMLLLLIIHRFRKTKVWVRPTMDREVTSARTPSGWIGRS